MNKSVIIFGSAPYYDKIKPFIPELIQKYDTVGINDRQLQFPFKIWAFVDDFTPFIEQVKPFETAITRQCRRSGVPKEYQNKFEYFGNAGSHIIHSLDHKALCIHWYTITFVLNYVYLKGYKDVYLAGIEHPESCSHYGGGNIRDFIYKYKEYMNLYQLDTESTMDLEKRSVKDLL